jgi:hypothetical protein
MLYTLVVFTGHQPIENQWRSASNNHVVQTVNRRNEEMTWKLANKLPLAGLEPRVPWCNDLEQ